MRLIRAGAGPDAILLGGGPLLPSIGLVDAMRIGPDSGDAHGRLLQEAGTSPRHARLAPRKASPVLETITLVLERAGRPMQAREIHAIAEQLPRPPCWRRAGA